MKISEKIRELREKAGLTQEELADRVGVQRNTVWRWENGKAKLKADNIQRLSFIFNVEPASLMPNIYEVPSQDNKNKIEVQEVSPSMAYWGAVLDNAKIAVKSGQNLGLIYSMLADATGTVKAAMV
mgnify:CR=1 FL=1